MYGFEKTDVLESRTDPLLAPNLEQFAVPFGQMSGLGRFKRRRGNDERGSQTGPQGKSSAGLIQDELMLPTLEVAPLSHGDHRRNDQSLIGDCFLHVRDLASPGYEFPNVVKPKFNSVIARFPNQTDFVQKGLWFDGAGVQAIDHENPLG